MLIDEIKELNETLYKAFGKLKENSDNINDTEHKKSVADKIMELYEMDYKLIYGRFAAEEKRVSELEIDRLARKSEFERRRKALTPKVRRPWYFLFLIPFRNRAEKLTEREADANAEKFLNAKQKAVEELEKILAVADNAPLSEAFEEPKQGQTEEKRESPAEKAKGQLQGQVSIEELDVQQKPVKSGKRGQ